RYLLASTRGGFRAARLARAAHPVRNVDGHPRLSDASLVDLQDGRRHDSALDRLRTAIETVGDPCTHLLRACEGHVAHRLADRVCRARALVWPRGAPHGRHAPQWSAGTSRFESLQGDV